MKALDEVQNHLKWCNEYIEYFKTHCEFDPIAALMETEDRDQKMFHLCCDYLYNIEKINRAFDTERRKTI